MKALLAVVLAAVLATTQAVAQAPPAPASAPIAFVTPAPADFAERLPLARRLMDVPGLADVYLPSFDQVVTSVITDGPPDPGAAARFTQALKDRRPELLEAAAHTYARALNLAELRGLVDFYETPVGRRVAAKWIQAMQPVSDLLAAFGPQVMAAGTPGAKIMPLPDYRGSGPAPSIRALALANQAVESSNGVRMAVTLPDNFENLDAPTQARVRKDMERGQGVLDRLKPRLFEKLSNIYAVIFSEEELQAVVVFFRTPAGVAANAANRSMNQDFGGQEGGALINLILLDALRPPSDTRPPSSFNFQAAPSAARMDLARRMLEASGALAPGSEVGNLPGTLIAGILPADGAKEANTYFAQVGANYRAHSKELMELAVVSYARNFSEDELQGQLDFMLSPAGKAFAAKLPAMASRLGAALAPFNPLAAGAPPAPETAGPQPSAAQVELALQIVEVSNAATETFNANGRARRYGTHPLTPQEDSALEPFERDVAHEALIKLPKMKRAVALVYARTFTEEELRGILAFFRSPAGRTLQERTPWMNADMGRLGGPLLRQVLTGRAPG